MLLCKDVSNRFFKVSFLSFSKQAVLKICKSGVWVELITFGLFYNCFSNRVGPGRKFPVRAGLYPVDSTEQSSRAEPKIHRQDNGPGRVEPDRTGPDRKFPARASLYPLASAERYIDTHKRKYRFSSALIMNYYT